MYCFNVEDTYFETILIIYRAITSTAQSEGKKMTHTNNLEKAA